MAYDLWNLAPPALPPRSRLYSLQPMATGTSRVESLTSYMMRLAETHTVSVRTLIQQEIFPNLSTSPKNTHFSGLRSLNGMGACFEQWVNVLGSLTSRSDLRALTLLPWQGWLSSGGILRRHRAWCPRCFQEWRHHRLPIYECLSWALTPVTVCPLHHTLLEERCPNCRRRMLLLAAHAHPGFCAHCNRWMGDCLPAATLPRCEQLIEDQLWTAKQVGEFLGVGGAVKENGSPRHLLDNLQHAVSDLAKGNHCLFARAAKIECSVLQNWFKGRCSPSLPFVIRISQTLRVPLRRLMCEKISGTDSVWTALAKEGPFVGRPRQRTVRPQYLVTRVVSLSPLPPAEREVAKAEIKACLEKNLELDEPRPIVEVFWKLGYRSASRGRGWFPGLCAATKAKREQRDEIYRRELLAALAEEPPPTLAQVALRLGISIPTLRQRRACRDLCKALSLRYPDRRRFQEARIEAGLRKALDEPPVPLIILASRLHKDPNRLRVTFPDLCRRLRARYMAQRSLEQQRVRLVYESAVRQAIGEIADAGEYPSLQRTFSFILKRNPSLTSLHLTNLAIKRIRMKLGQPAQATSWLEFDLRSQITVSLTGRDQLQA